MNIYKISQSAVYGYDTYSDAVVIAPDEATARRIHPRSGDEVLFIERDRDWDSWVGDPKLVTAELIGKTKATELRVVCASYHAG